MKNSTKTFLTKRDFPIPNGPLIKIILLSCSFGIFNTNLSNSSTIVLTSSSLPIIKILEFNELISIFPSESILGLSLLVLIKEKCGKIICPVSKIGS